jgi:glucarate dehydratase
MGSITITGVSITPVAFHDPPLLNAAGLHEPFALRAVLEVTTDAGLTGLGETYGDSGHLDQLRQAAAAVSGLDVYALTGLRARVAAALGGQRGGDAHGLTGPFTEQGTVDRVFSPFEVACLDIQGKAVGRPVSDLLGGAVRAVVPYSAYLFYKPAAHPGADADEWGEAVNPAGIVAQAGRMLAEYGFGSIKLKGGVFPPEQEIDAMLALREAFPGRPLRLDPNAAWTPETSIRVGEALDGVLEYLEDPTPGMAGMARVASKVPMPLATNMCVVSFEHLPPAIAGNAVQIVLSDHHYWGGFTHTRLLAGICATFGIGLSMHSNSHLGISLAAMTHLGAVLPQLPYALDTHWPWKRADEDIIAPGPLRFEAGSVPVPTGPGLGVELDRDALARLHQQYLACGLRQRDDTTYMRRIEPGFVRKVPRW